MPSLFKTRSRSEDENWVSVSDLMAGLMMVFLFIAVIYAKDADKRANAIQEVVTTWQQQEQDIYEALYRSLRTTLWKAEVKRTLTIRFASPDILFDDNNAVLKPEFTKMLDEFVPKSTASCV